MIADLATSSGFSNSAENIVRARGLTAEALIGTGLRVSGAKVVSVRAPAGVSYQVSGGPDSTLIEVNERRAVVLAVRFAGGSGSGLWRFRAT